ncbi:MAG: glutamate-5-semialdehyde dehydrogenase [Puniceicoccales bacterium]|jgi:glutamate-5-semialdehyde dehydrogenase|nr:glutamate-5-semialdehyde dehydrogenase [Puniceicoccales bacterium]
MSTTTPLLAQLTETAIRARRAARILTVSSTEQKNAAITAIAEKLRKNTPRLLEANEQDIAAAKARGLSTAMIDRLRLTPERMEAMAGGAMQVARLPDPVGVVLERWTRPNGLEIIKKSVPIGVIGIIYESRPNVTCDAAVLCLKAGNATILRGGSEAFHSNTAIADTLEEALAEAGLPGAVSFVPTTDREAIPLLCSLDKYIDVMIPRGGHGLISTVVEHARMPVIKHYNGICHVFVERNANLKMAEEIIVNAKCQRPGVCNAMETLLVDAPVAAAFVPQIAARLKKEGVEIRTDAETRKAYPELASPNNADWDMEYLDLIMNLRVVEGVDAAIEHIEQHGSHHSDSIITEDKAVAEKFLNAVDSAAVYWNASTRFTDGSEFGFGAEIGIGTGKLHARGPMGLRELTTYKYQIVGTGQVRK